VAGAGNQLTVWLVRHSQRKRGATDRPDLRSTGASPRPYRARFRGSADRNLWHATVCYVPVTSLAWISLCPLSPICSIAKTLISLGPRSDVFLARDRFSNRIFRQAPRKS